MRIGGSLRQIILVALTAIAAVTIGQALRQAVDRANATVNDVCDTAVTCTPLGGAGQEPASALPAVRNAADRAATAASAPPATDNRNRRMTRALRDQTGPRLGHQFRIAHRNFTGIGETARPPAIAGGHGG